MNRLQPKEEPDTCDVIKGMVSTELAITLTIPDKAKAERKRAEVEAAAEMELAGRDPGILLHHRKVRHAARSWLAQNQDRIDKAVWRFHVAHAEHNEDIRAYADDIRRFVEELAESARQDCIEARDGGYAASEPQAFKEILAHECLDAVRRPPSSTESAKEFLDLLRGWWAHARLVRRRVRPWYNLGQFLGGFILIPISFLVWMAAEIRCAIAPAGPDRRS